MSLLAATAIAFTFAPDAIEACQPSTPEIRIVIQRPVDAMKARLLAKTADPSLSIHVCSWLDSRGQFVEGLQITGFHPVTPQTKQLPSLDVLQESLGEAHLQFQALP